MKPNLSILFQSEKFISKGRKLYFPNSRVAAGKCMVRLLILKRGGVIRYLPSLQIQFHCTASCRCKKKVFLDCRLRLILSFFDGKNSKFSNPLFFLPQQQSPSITFCLRHITLLNLLLIPFSQHISTPPIPPP